MAKVRAPQGWVDIDPHSDRQWLRKAAHPYLLYVEEKPQPDGSTLWDFQIHHMSMRPGSYEHSGYRTTRAAAIKTCNRYVEKYHERAQKLLGA